MKIQQFLAPDAVSLSLARSPHPAAAPARGFSSRYVPVIVCMCHLHTRGWSCGAGGCRWEGRQACSSRSPRLAPHARRRVLLPVKYCRCERSWHFVSEQPPGSGRLNFSCSPVAPTFSLHRSGSLFPWKETKDTSASALGSTKAIAAISSSTPG